MGYGGQQRTIEASSGGEAGGLQGAGWRAAAGLAPAVSARVLGNANNANACAGEWINLAPGMHTHTRQYLPSTTQHSASATRHVPALAVCADGATGRPPANEQAGNCAEMGRHGAEMAEMAEMGRNGKKGGRAANQLAHHPPLQRALSRPSFISHDSGPLARRLHATFTSFQKHCRTRARAPRYADASAYASA
jgi:hypothetical protein